VFASGVVLPLIDLPRDVMRALPRAFWFWQAVGALVTLRLIVGLWHSLKTVARQAAEDEKEMRSE
jgi:hypothetical protein